VREGIQPAVRLTIGRSDVMTQRQPTAGPLVPQNPQRARLLKLAWRLETPLGLLIMFAIALTLRLAIAPVIGYYGDLNVFRTWAQELSSSGIHGFYKADPRADYPPGYLYYLWLVGKISPHPSYLLLKSLAILCDLGLAWVAGTFAARLAPKEIVERIPVRALVAAAVLFNPAIFGDSTVYGEVEAVPALLVLSSLFLLLTGPRSVQRDAAAFAILGVALITKPQAAFGLPVMLYVLYLRYLRRRRAAQLVDGALSVGLIGLSAIVVWLLLALPFGLGPVKLYHLYKYSSSLYPVTSTGAFNFWGAIHFLRPDHGPRALEVASIPAYRFGILCFIAAAAIVIWLSHRAIEGGAGSALTLAFAAAATSLFGFTFLTRMHERYMFPALALLAPLIFARPMRRAYVALSSIFVLNLWFAFGHDNGLFKDAGYNVHTLRIEPWYGWIVGGSAFDAWQKRVLSALVTLIALVLTWRGVGYCRQQTIQSEIAAETRSERGRH
jgi:dolichyl-phosphate-mannose-protein mannosyltransferase